jgi:hypothetical protein
MFTSAVKRYSKTVFITKLTGFGGLPVMPVLMRSTINKGFRMKGKFKGFEFWYDGIKATLIIPKGTKISMEKHISDLHEKDRTHYDTPASVMNCYCKSCQEARKMYTPEKYNSRAHWSKHTIFHFGEIEGLHMSQSCAEGRIENMIEEGEIKI